MVDGENRSKDDVVEALTIHCGESLDISNVRSLWGQFKSALEDGIAVNMMGGEVSRADAAALQTLCCFFQDASSAGLDVKWIETSQALRDSAGLLDLTEHLRL